MTRRTPGCPLEARETRRRTAERRNRRIVWQGRLLWLAGWVALLLDALRLRRRPRLLSGRGKVQVFTVEAGGAPEGGQVWAEQERKIA